MRAETTDLPPGVELRPLTPADRALLADLPSRVSPQSAISRFHGALSQLSEPLLDHLLRLEAGQREAFVALHDGVIIGVARFARDDPESDTAEVAFLVADAWQHHGLGYVLLDRVVERARAARITRFRADMLATNTAARHLIEAAGPIVESRVEDGHLVLTVELPA